MTHPLSRLPKVDRVLAHPALARYRDELGTPIVTNLVRQALDDVRARVQRGEVTTESELEAVATRVSRSAAQLLQGRIRRVINATGVVLHTNLGRAPLSATAVRALSETAGGYSNIEFDLETGKRGRRGSFVEHALSAMTGAEATLVVNNNAAAVLLALSALSFKKSVIVSRGELIEIGGGFRIPEVLARSGADLIEVGTTNRTRRRDYEAAITERTGAILSVHPGNFKQVGFVERPSLSELAVLAKAHCIPLIFDLGGGALCDLEAFGLQGEPTAQAAVAAGADVVCFSTDKVLGGPQGGALVGKLRYIDVARRDPLARALRLGRLPMTALEATLADYLKGLPVPALLALGIETGKVKERAARWQRELAARGVEVQVVELSVAVGGGALAEEPLPSFGIAVRCESPDRVLARLRRHDPPVVARIGDGQILCDARTVLTDEDEWFLNALTESVSSGSVW